MLNIARKDTLLKKLGCSRSVLDGVINSIDLLYTVTETPKSSGGVRVIEAPKPVLKRIQKKIHLLLKRYPLSDCAFGSVRGRSNKDNAYAHSHCAVVFQSDLRSFYPSVYHARVYRIFLSMLGCSPAIARILTRLTTYNYHLPTGSPTSPYLANLIMLDTDIRLDKLADEMGLIYTRYMDDVTFSGKHISRHFLDVFYDVMRCSGFELHHGKTGIFYKCDPQLVTGIGINTGRLKVPRDYKAKLRAIEQAGKNGSIPMAVVEKRLEGMRAYIHYVESQ